MAVGLQPLGPIYNSRLQRVRRLGSFPVSIHTCQLHHAISSSPRHSRSLPVKIATASIAHTRGAVTCSTSYTCYHHLICSSSSSSTTTTTTCSSIPSCMLQQSTPLPAGHFPAARRMSTIICCADGSNDSSSSSSNPNGTSNSSSSSSNSNSTTPSKRGSPHKPGRGWGWLPQVTASIKLQAPLRILFNIVVLYVLMRIWPLGGRSGPFSNGDNIIIQVPFSEFVKRVKHDEVNAVSMDGLHINFALRPDSALLSNRPEGTDASRVSFCTVRPSDYSMPYDVLEQHGVVFSAVNKQGNGFMSILVYALYVGLLLSVLNRLPIKLPQKGTARKHKGEQTSSSITFADVAGVDEAKEELFEIVEYLRAPERFSKLGARPPSGVLLVGPPGTGKTMLAKAVAGEADVPFFSISASEFVELYVGMGAMRVRELFATARKEAPAIVFIDEIDAVAKGRDTRLRSVGNDEREQTLNQLLTELDGFDSDKDNVVICIAATNRPDVLDTALLRPGRFDRRVSVERPDRLGREQILQVHLARRGLPLADDVSAHGIACSTTGFTGADLANLVNEAALLAGRRGKSMVSREEFDQAIMRAIAGIEKKRSILVGMEKDVVAKHEVGHALVGTAIACVLPVHSSQVEKLSIIPRSAGALGFTYIPPKTEDRALMFDSEIRGQLAMLMGGRAAEQLTCSAVSTGAVDDIRRATDLAHKAVSEFGLSPSIGPINVGVLSAGNGDDAAWLLRDSGDMSKQVEAEARAWLEGALTCAMDVIEANKEIHEGLSNALCVNERLEGDDLQKWLVHVQAPASLHDFVLHGKVPPRRAPVDLPSVPSPAAIASAAAA